MRGGAAGTTAQEEALLNRLTFSASPALTIPSGFSLLHCLGELSALL